MALHRGIQSAIFYYVALICSPCSDVRGKKKRKQEARENRRERELLQEAHPHLYRHPSPSSTNPYWQADIALGPSIVRGKRKGNNGNGDGSRGRKAGRYTANDSADPSSVDLARQKSLVGRNDRNWNTRLYQREDEELWGGSTSNFGGSIYGDTLRRPPTAHTNSSSMYRNPPINEMHPATVTTVNSREEVMWMLQPPPVAEVMSGKERVPRSRSDSGASRLNSSSAAMSRQVSSRLTQHRATPMSREGSNQTSKSASGQRHDRSTTTSERDFAASPIQPERAKRKPSPIQTLRASEESIPATFRRHSLAPSPEIDRKPQIARVASRPQLSTIVSDNDIPLVLGAGFRTPPRAISRENSRPDSGNEVAVEDDESPPVVTISDKRNLGLRPVNGKRTTTAPEIKEGVAIRYSTGHKYQDSEDDFMTIRKELIDSWYTPDFELPKWVHEHTKREVKQRWSMDL